MVTTKLKWFIAIGLFGFFYSTALGCQYTVRDVGFTDIGSTPYRLYCYIQEDTPDKFASTFKQISYVALMDSNVEVELINVDQQKEHPKMTYLHFWEISSFPAAILVSPKGHSVVLPISDRSKSSNEAIWSALEDVVSSSKRKEILQHIVKAYCVILLIQGDEKYENQMARKAVNGAIDEITKIMMQMTKTIEEPPHLIVLDPESFSEEKVLLWSLGVNEKEMSNPCVAVIYGRGRQIGQLLTGEKITTNAIYNLLSVIGLACECGYDTRWTLGMTIPLRWDEKVRSEVVKLLGFDAESPMVKMEISQILSMSSSGGAAIARTIQQGYKEEVVEFESSTSAAMVSPAQLREMNSTKPVSSEVRSTFQLTLFVVGGMVLLILAGGVLIILRARRKAL